MSISFRVTDALVGQRLDSAVANAVPEISRAHAQRLIELGAITVAGSVVKSSYRLREGEQVSGELPEPEPASLDPEDIPLDVRYEDSHLLVVDKPAGLVVHPAPGNRSGTLVNALLHASPELVAGGEKEKR